MIKKFTDHFFRFLGYFGMAALVIICVFIENPITYLLYAFLITVAVHFNRLKDIKTDFRYVIRDFSIILSVIYLVLIIVMSLSPFLKIQEFKISHWHWKATETKQIRAVTAWHNGYKRMGNSYTDVYYTYQAGNELYKKTESKALEKYYPFWNFQENDERVNEFSQSVSEKIRKKDFVIFYSQKNPEKSKFFLSSDLFYFQGSLFYDFITSFAIAIFTVIGLLCAFFIFGSNKRDKTK